MATNQYIGARYVPLFAEPYEWDSTKEYEPLTIVYHKGNSYTSRQYVPTGIDILNEEFWALTGNYNSQVEQYREEVRTYNDRITKAQDTADAATATATEAKSTADNALSLGKTNESDIAANDAELAGTAPSGLKTLIENEVSRATAAESKNESDIATEVSRATSAESKNESAIDAEVERAKTAESALKSEIADIPTYDPDKLNGKVLCIGDSYARMEDVSLTSWPKLVSDALNADELSKYAEGGSGWNTKGNSNHSFTDLVTQAIAEISDKDSYRLVIIAGGRNDGANQNMSTLVSVCKSMFGTLKTAFPKARIIAVPLLWDNKRNYARGNMTVVNAVNEAACESGVEFVNWAWTWGLGLDSEYDSGFHPKQGGENIIANYILQAIRGSYSGRYVREFVTDFGSGDCYVVGSGGTMTVNVGGTYNNNNGTLSNTFRADNQGACWGVIFTNGGSGTGIINLSNTKIEVIGGGDKGNIGGSFSMPW